MPKISPTNPKKIISFLLFLGFEISRQKGSHIFFRHKDGRTTVVPFHQNEDLGVGLISKILRDIEVSRDEFLNWIGSN